MPYLMPEDVHVKSDVLRRKRKKKRRKIKKHGHHDQRTHGNRYGGAMWGSSSGNSFTMTGHAAELMGITGYRTYNTSDEGYTKFARRSARGLLRGIVQAKPRTRPLYHGEVADQERLSRFEKGKIIRLPLTATGNEQILPSAFSRKKLHETDKTQVMLEFVPGVKAHKYQPGEWVTAGDFRVTEIKEGEPQMTFDYDAQDWVTVPTTHIVLEQVEVFDPDVIQKDGFDPHQPRDPHSGKWVDIIPGIGLPTGVERVLPSTKLHRRRPVSRKVTESTASARELPRTPGKTEKDRALASARDYPTAERKYAELIVRLAGKGKTQQPSHRGTMSQRYGISAGRLMEIENEMIGSMFPPKSKRGQSKTLSTQDTTRALRSAMAAQGARSATSLPGGGKLFKAMKGENRGRLIEMARNGAIIRVVPKQSENKVTRDAKAFESAETQRRKDRSKAAQIKRANELRAENEALQESVTDRKLNTQAKINRAKAWAQENGFDPDDSYWWAFYWRDPSLLQRQDDASSVTTNVPKATSRARRKGQSPEILDLPDISARRMRGHRPGPRKAAHGDEIGKRFSEFTKWDFDPHQPRDYRGRWTDTPGLGGVKAIGRRAGVGIAAEQHSRTGGGGSTLWAKGTVADRKSIPRINRGGKHIIEGTPSPLEDPGKAYYQRNNGSTQITNRRLKEIFEDPSKMTTKEKTLIGSAGGSKALDGTSTIKIQTSRGPREAPRYDVIGQVRSKMAPGSGNRSAKREGISTERRQKINEKRQASGKVSSTAFGAISDRIAKDWSMDGKTVLCVFCGKPVRIHGMSIETPKPKELGGGYQDPGNTWPAHKSCNTKAGVQAKSDAKTYYEDMMQKFMRVVPPEVKEKLPHVYKSHQKYLGTYAAAKKKGFK